jgi:hypothetical protein
MMGAGSLHGTNFTKNPEIPPILHPNRPLHCVWWRCNLLVNHRLI